jgi:hypothetical protein
MSADGPHCAVLGMGVFSAGYPNASALAGGANPAANAIGTNAVAVRSTAVSGELLDKHSRRRASELTKACADVYREALLQAALDPIEVAAVFGSALGEASTTIGLLEQLWRGPGMLSPMRFASSVHNAAAGVVSIGTKNRGFTTALGADHDTPAMALLEGFAFALVHQTPVIVVCADEGAPENLVDDEAGWGFLAGAVAIAPLALAPAHAPRISAPARAEAAGWVLSDLPRTLAQNPCVGVLDLIAAVGRPNVSAVRLDRGRGHGYSVSITRPA